MDEVREIEAIGRTLIGQRFKRLRLGYGWSQRQLAWRCGVTQSTISRLERGTLGGLNFATLARLEAAFAGRHGSWQLDDPPAPPSRRLPGMGSELRTKS